VIHAELSWEKQVAEVTPNFADSRARLEFPFNNSGSSPLKILSVNPVCDCVTAKALSDAPNATNNVAITPDTFAPGEHGKIVAVFDIGARQGPQEKKIEVITNDPKEPKVELTLKVNIPEIVQLGPTFVHWKEGEKMDARKVALKVAPEFPLKNVRVTSSSALIHAELKPSQTARGSTPEEYEVLIIPKTEGVPIQALANLHAEINVRIEDNVGHTKNYPIHVRVRGNTEIATE
jgi:hypothetical protein